MCFVIPLLSECPYFHKQKVDDGIDRMSVQIIGFLYRTSIVSVGVYVMCVCMCVQTKAFYLLVYMVCMCRHGHFVFLSLCAVLLVRYYFSAQVLCSSLVKGQRI